MNKFERIATALLAVIAVEGAVTAYEMRKIVENGFEVELSDAEVAEIESEVADAAEQAFKDMEDE